MKIYCAGIGGIGLSAYAALQYVRGNDVSGSDRAASVVTQDLEKLGVRVAYEQDGSHVPADADLFAYTEAIPPQAPERARATELGLKQVSYFQALGQLTAGLNLTCVCGTHGKSSTTAMLAKVLVGAGKDPTVVVGTRVPQLQNRNWRAGAGDLAVVEACEYRRSFHFLSPRLVLMTNVSGDHFDAYGSVSEYRRAFVEFLQRLPADGAVVTHGNDEACVDVVRQSGRRLIDADALALPALSTPGVHMQQNAQLALAAAMELGVDEATARTSLAGFTGTWRRSEHKGEFRGIPVIDDYGHHPNEIRATLKAFRELHPEARLVCVFQPHTHNRTLALYDEFTRAFADADVVVIPNVYDARHDTENAMVNVDALVRDIAETSEVEAVNGTSLAQTEALLRDSLLQPGDVLVCMGAGDITTLAGNLTA